MQTDGDIVCAYLNVANFEGRENIRVFAQNYKRKENVSRKGIRTDEQGMNNVEDEDVVLRKYL
jgi:hypothetical protein